VAERVEEALRRAEERTKREEEDRELLAAGFLKEGSSAWRTPGGVPCSRQEGLESLRQRRHRRRDEGAQQ
jgi:hypothetical protein